MSKTRETTERQLNQAKQAVAAREDVLKQKGVDSEQFKRDTIWRGLRARARKIYVRLERIGEIEVREQGVEERRAARVAGATAAVEAE